LTKLLVAVLTLAGAQAAGAETAYVTDMLRLGIHQAADASDAAFANLMSGEAVEVQKRAGAYARVKMQDGREGWVKSAFLVAEKPARLRLQEAEAATASLQEQLAAAQAARAKAEQSLAELKQARLTDAHAVQSARESLARISAENETYETRLERYRHSLPLSWVLAALPFAVLLGFAGGGWALDAWIRRRHGGFRIY
jgi:SH3 domain protein